MTLLDLVALLHPEMQLVTNERDVPASADAYVYVLAPPFRRRALLRRLQRLGLRPAAAFLHVRGPAENDLLVQLDRRALSCAASATVSAPAWMRAVVRFAPDALLRASALVLPRVGVACRPERGDALAAWLHDAASASTPPLLLQRTRVDGRDRRLVHALGPRAAIVKLDGDGVDERRRLEEHGPAAAAAGAAVPQPIPFDAAPAGAVGLTLLHGRAASAAIAGGVESPDDVVARVAAWLERWNGATAVAASVDEPLLEEHVLAPAAALEAVLPDGGRYRSWLERRARDWLGSELVLVTAHLDLTMANVLLTRGGGIAVVDWAQARSDFLPLVDLLYAAADAAAAAHSYRDRADAFHSDAYARLVRVHEERSAKELGLGPDVRELCFHACWLHHARNELEAGATDAPFRRIVAAVAANATGRESA